MSTCCEHRSIALFAGSVLALSATAGHAQEAGSASAAERRIEALQQQLTEQGRQIEALQQLVNDQENRYRESQRAARSDPQARDKAGTDANAPGVAAATGPQPATAEGEARPVHVGVAPSAEAQPPVIAPLFDQPGILTPRGHYVLEPSMQYGYSSSNRVALVGYTVIPSLLIGLIDVREVKRNTFTAAVTGRWGLTNRLEVEAKLPYVYRSDSAISREILNGSATDSVFNTSGQAIGDVEFAARYQLNQPRDNTPYLIGSLRLKTRTGKDPFEVETDCVTRCVGNTTGTGLPTELPTGSGFYSLQPALTWLFPSDPAVFFGGISYAHNFGRSNLSRQVRGGEQEFIGSIKPGDIWGVNFGMGLALNDRSSFSAGVELNSIGRTKQNGAPVAGSVRTQLSSLLLGYSYRYSEKTTVNVTVGAGLTRDTPDLSLGLRVPMSF